MADQTVFPPSTQPNVSILNLYFTHSNERQVNPFETRSKLFLVFSFAPALLACCILLARAFQHIQYRPEWLQTFVHEPIDHSKSVNKRHHSSPLILLLLSCLLGFVIQLIAIFLPVRDLTPLPRALTWVAHLISCIFYYADNEV